MRVIIKILFTLLLIAACETQNILQNVIDQTRNILNIPGNLVRDTSTFRDSYDFIIVGAGSAGCALANRLTEIDDWNVLLLEAGKDELIITDVPLASTYWTFTDFNWGFKTVPQNDICLGLNERKCTWPRGRSMGGTSVINYLVYTRGHPEDYDEWARLGNTGWSYRDVLPYFIKSEKVGIPGLRNSPYRGTKGYVNVEHPPWKTPLADAFIDAGRELGYDINDPNGPDVIGFSRVQATMKNGRRVSASKAYIRPIRNRRNLHVAKGARVVKILIDPKTNSTYGVEFVKRRRSYTVRANREVLLSAGTLSSPQLLMLSGIGPRKHLEQLRIPVIRDAPVGENLIDHVSFGTLIFLVNDSVSIVDSRISRNISHTFDYFFRNTGPLTSPGGAEGLAFVNTRISNNVDDDGLHKDVPDIEIVFGGGALPGDTSGVQRKSFGIREDIFREMYGNVLGRDGFTLVPILLKPKSKGYLRLNSKNPYQWPLFYPGYYTEESDLRAMVRGIRMAIKIGETKSFQRFGTKLHDVPFPACRQHKFNTDEYWMCAARQITTNLHHQVGTCKMGPANEPESVVDPQLRVIGVSSLRVVDSSIMPTVPASHTNSVAMMIAEKAADLIKNTYNRRFYNPWIIHVFTYLFRTELAKNGFADPLRYQSFPLQFQKYLPIQFKRF